MASMISPHRWRTLIPAAIAIASSGTRSRSPSGVASYFWRNFTISAVSEKRMALNASLIPPRDSFRMLVMFGEDASCSFVTPSLASAPSLRLCGISLDGTFCKFTFDKFLLSGSDNIGEPVVEGFSGGSLIFLERVFGSGDVSDGCITCLRTYRIRPVIPCLRDCRDMLEGYGDALHSPLVALNLVLNGESVRHSYLSPSASIAPFLSRADRQHPSTAQAQADQTRRALRSAPDSRR